MSNRLKSRGKGKDIIEVLRIAFTAIGGWDDVLQGIGSQRFRFPEFFNIFLPL